MSTAIVREEISRFLKSGEAEVLCISGDWGVGKTYAWQKFFVSSEESGEISLNRYAYVSLFGLSSLTDLRNAITENTISIDNKNSTADVENLRKALKKGEELIRKGRPALEIATSVFRLKDAGDALYRAAFLAIKNQIVCFDDLERSSDSLRIKDVLGLASFLKDQRNCKVIILLNREKATPTDKKDLDEQLEKVVDTFLVFDPTSEEAINIAVSKNDNISNLLKENLLSLSIKNIRVIKKIERLAFHLGDILKDNDSRILHQAISTLTLSAWSFFQPSDAPSLEYIEKFNPYEGIFQNGKEKTKEQIANDEILNNYGYKSTDELDLEIIKGVRLGYFNSDDIKKLSAVILTKISSNDRDNSFSKAWDLYHGSLGIDDKDILDSMEAGISENLGSISLGNIDATLRFLSRHGRARQANRFARSYVKEHEQTPGFFSRSNRVFIDGPGHPLLIKLLEEGRQKILSARNPSEILKNMARNDSFNPSDDIPLFSKLTVSDLVKLLDDAESSDIKGMAQWLNRLGEQPEGTRLRRKVRTAFKSIGARSPMRLERLVSWGVLPPTTKQSPKARSQRAKP